MKERSPGSRAAVETQTESKTLDGEEEKVIRMRHGLAAPEGMPLPRHAEHHPDVAEQLRQMELRALRMSGRLKELADEAGVEPVEQVDGVKEKIIDKLKGP